MSPKIVRPDSKGRITLGHLADGISGFVVTQTKDHKIILEPYAEIPAKDKWMFDKKKFLLADLLSKVTPQNLHTLEIEDAPRGNKKW